MTYNPILLPEAEGVGYIHMRIYLPEGVKAMAVAEGLFANVFDMVVGCGIFEDGLARIEPFCIVRPYPITRTEYNRACDMARAALAPHLPFGCAMAPVGDRALRRMKGGAFSAAAVDPPEGYVDVKLSERGLVWDKSAAAPRQRATL